MRVPRVRLLMTTMAVIIVAGGFSVLAQVSRPPSPDQLAREAPGIVNIGDVLLRVRDGHVDEVPESELVEAAIRGMLSILDENSSYFTPEEFRDYVERSTGEFEGIGAMVSWDEEIGAVRIENVFDESPALRAGLMRGDLITEVDGRPTADLDLQRAVDFIRGPAGSTVMLRVLRSEQELSISVARGAITSPVVTQEILEDDIMYVRLRGFNERAAGGIEEAIVDMRTTIANDNRTPRGLILDLRNNPGGFLDQAIQVSDMFLDRGLIVETRGRDDRNVSRASARRGQFVERELPMVVLINEFSASASEIVASALKAHGRATVIGVKSFGKGTVQTIHQFADGSALRLTIARYFTAEGGTIDMVGVTPNIVVEAPEDLRVGDPDAVDPQLDAAVKQL